MAKLESAKIGERIARLRKDRGLTQKELADRLDVSQPVVSDYENADSDQFGTAVWRKPVPQSGRSRYGNLVKPVRCCG